MAFDPRGTTAWSLMNVIAESLVISVAKSGIHASLPLSQSRVTLIPRDSRGLVLFSQDEEAFGWLWPTNFRVLIAPRSLMAILHPYWTDSVEGHIDLSLPQRFPNCPTLSRGLPTTTPDIRPLINGGEPQFPLRWGPGDVAAPRW